MAFDWKDVAIGGSTGGLYNAAKYLQGGYDDDKGGGGIDVGGEMGKIQALFAKLKAQNEVNINRSAGQGRRQAASNLATRGVYSSPVSENTFNALEGERLNALATSEAQLAGQEAEMRARVLSTLMGYDRQDALMAKQAKANRFGQFAGIGSNLLLAMLMRNPAGAAGAVGGAGNLAENSPMLPYPQRMFPNTTPAYSPMAAKPSPFFTGW